MPSLHDLRADTLEGDERALADSAGKALLSVNVASKRGLTDGELPARFGPTTGPSAPELLAAVEKALRIQ